MRTSETPYRVRLGALALSLGILVALVASACSASSSDQLDEPAAEAPDERSARATETVEEGLPVPAPAAEGDGAARPDPRPRGPAVGTPASAECVRPYAPESPWNTPIGVSEPIDPDSAFYVATLGDALTSDPTQFTYPVYEISGDTPVRTVRLDGWFSNVTGNGRLMQNDRGVAVELPIPDGAAPAAGDDSQIIIVDLESGEEWGAFRFRQTESGEYVAENAYHYNTAWDGVPPPSTGGGVFVNRGSGVPYLAGLVRPCEIAAGRIEHALAFAYASPSPDYVYPATKSDGAGELHNDLPEGARLQLDPGLTDEDLTGLGCTNACLTVAHALQEYGMFVVDNSGRPKVMVEFEGTASWQGAIDEGTVSPIPLERLRVLDTRTIPARAGCTITGTSGDDVLVGTRSADVICGLEGDDEIEGLEGNDVIYGGAGRDVIDGGGGQDRVEAGAGDDRVAGDAGWDVLDGGEGEDWIDGGRGSDRIFAADGEADVVDGGPGSNEAQLDAADTATAVTAS